MKETILASSDPIELRDIALKLHSDLEGALLQVGQLKKDKEALIEQRDAAYAKADNEHEVSEELKEGLKKQYAKFCDEMDKNDRLNGELVSALKKINDNAGEWEYSEALSFIRDVLHKIEKRKCVPGCMDRHFCNAPKLHEGGCHCKLDE